MSLIWASSWEHVAVGELYRTGPTPSMELAPWNTKHTHCLGSMGELAPRDKITRELILPQHQVESRPAPLWGSTLEVALVARAPAS